MQIYVGKTGQYCVWESPFECKMFHNLVLSLKPNVEKVIQEVSTSIRHEVFKPYYAAVTAHDKIQKQYQARWSIVRLFMKKPPPAPSFQPYQEKFIQALNDNSTLTILKSIVEYPSDYGEFCDARVLFTAYEFVLSIKDRLAEEMHLHYPDYPVVTETL